MIGACDPGILIAYTPPGARGAECPHICLTGWKYPRDGLHGFIKRNVRDICHAYLNFPTHEVASRNGEPSGATRPLGGDGIIAEAQGRKIEEFQGLGLPGRADSSGGGPYTVREGPLQFRGP